MTKSGAIRTVFFESDIRPLQEMDGVYSKLDAPPLSLSGFSPTAQIGAIPYKS